MKTKCTACNRVIPHTIYNALIENPTPLCIECYLCYLNQYRDYTLRTTQTFINLWGEV